jgi:phosphoglycolate phosphatase
VNLRAVVFDFDFTLVDSSRGFIDCHDFACRELSLEPVGAEASMAMMGTPLHEAFRLLFPDEHHTLADDYVRLWQLRADEVMTDLTEVYPDAPRTIANLRKDGRTLGIVSQKLRRRIEAVLEREGLAGCFEAVIGGDDMRAFKPDPEGLLMACERLGARPPEAIYVGDTVIDGQAAANAGVPFVAVLSGVTPAAAFEPIPRLATLGDISALPDLCRRLSS